MIKGPSDLECETREKALRIIAQMQPVVILDLNRACWGEPSISLFDVLDRLDRLPWPFAGFLAGALFI